MTNKRARKHNKTSLSFLNAHTSQMGTTTSKQLPHHRHQPPPHPDPPPDTDFTCEICIEPVAATQRFQNRGLCSHPFCTDCVTKYITVRVTDDAVSEVTCPCPACRLSLDPLTCREVLPPHTFVRWCDNLCEKAVLGLDHRYCPNRDCSAMVVSECEGDVRRVECPDCKRVFCFKCGVPWHAGYRCEESGEMRDPNDVVFGELVETRKWMRCPRCLHCIELIEGCSIVKCRCGTSFCYKCGQKVNQHWCDCDRTMLWRVVCLRILIVIVVFLQLLFLFEALSRLSR